MRETRQQRKSRQSEELAKMVAEFQAKGGKAEALPKGAAGLRIITGKLLSVRPQTSDAGNTYDNMVEVLNFKRGATETLAARNEMVESLEVGKWYRFPTKMNTSLATSIAATMRISRKPEPCQDPTATPSDPSTSP